MSRLEYPFDPRWVDWEPRQSTIIRLPTTRGLRSKIARNRDKQWYKTLIFEMSQIVEAIDLLHEEFRIQMNRKDLINLYEDLLWEFDLAPPRNIPDDMVIGAVADALNSLTLSHPTAPGMLKSEWREPIIRTWGSSSVTDGQGTLIISQNVLSTIPLAQEQISECLKCTFDIRHVIQIPDHPASKDRPLASMVRFFGPGQVFLSTPPREYRNACHYASTIHGILDRHGAMSGNPLKMIQIPEARLPYFNGPFSVAYDEPGLPVLSYLTFIRFPHTIIMPHFGDLEADKNATRIFTEIRSSQPESLRLVFVRAQELANLGSSLYDVCRPVPARRQ